MHIARDQVRVPQHVGQDAEIGVHAVELELFDRAQGAADGIAEVAAGMASHHFGDQRVELRIGGVSGIAVGVDAYAGTRGRTEAAQHAGRWADLTVGTHALEIDASLNRVPARRRRLRQAQLRQLRSLGNPQLARDQVEAGHLFRHGVLDLQAGIGLDERNVASRIGLDEELEGAEVGVSADAGQLDSGRVDTFP